MLSLSLTIQKHKGIGLVEILVTVTASMLLMGGLINVMLSNNRLYRIDRNMAELQTNGRYANMFVTRAVRLAGFRTPPDFSNESGYSEFSDIFPTGSELLQGSNNNVNGSDTLTIRYQGSPSGNIFDCQGQAVQPNQMAENTFFVNDAAQLVCTAVNNGVPNPNNPSVLVDGVEAMQVRFGEDLSGDAMVNRYVTPSFADLSLDRIVSVRISFLLRSQEEASPTTNVSTYRLQDIDVGPFNDNYLRRVITSTVKIRNVTVQ